MKEFRMSCEKCKFFQQNWKGLGPIEITYFCNKYKEEFPIKEIGEEKEYEKHHHEKYDCFEDKVIPKVKTIPEIKPKVVPNISNNKIKFLRELAKLINEYADKEEKEVNYKFF